MGLRTRYSWDLIKEVPTEWIFEFYLNLEKLHGQEVKIHSIFRNERTPSMCIFLCEKSNEYKYKDFSSGEYGSAVDLVKHLFNLTYEGA
jgi:hypothetical protein